MPKVSPRARRLYERVPVWAGVLGGALLIAQVIAGISLATASGERPVAIPVQERETPAPPTPVAPATPEPEPTPEPEETTGPEADRIPEGEVVQLPAFDGKGSKVVGTVRDRKARLRFAELGKPWQPAKPQPEGPITDGEYSTRQTFVTEEYGDDRRWWADFDVLDDLPTRFTPGATLHATAAALLDYKQVRNFPGGTTGIDIASQPIKDGWLVAREMRMPPSSEGRKAERELAVAVAMDTGADDPALVWITIPETHKRLWPDVQTVVSSLRVLR
ncbi:hypothetical protein [Herbidospora sp. RD11066]